MDRRDPDAEIVLHGLSMGASAALIYCGREDVPDNIKAVISDCAFTDAYSMFREKIGSWFHLPAFPVVDSAELMIRLRAGYDLKETSPLKAVSASRLPTIFIHGNEDQMIPVSMCRELYKAAACEKEIMIVEGAGHAQAADKDPARYFEEVEKFLRVPFCSAAESVQRSGALFVQDHSPGPVHSRVISEYGKFEIRIAASVESSGFVVFLYRVKKDLAGFGDAASDHNDVRIYDTCDVRDRFAEHLADCLDH